jgi:hypothetical protein
MTLSGRREKKRGRVGQDGGIGYFWREMMTEKEVYRRKQKPKYLQIYYYRFLPIVGVLIYVYFSSHNVEKKNSDFLFVFDCFMVGLAALIFMLAKTSVSDSVREIIIDNSNGAIEVKYLKGFFHRRETSECCIIKYIKYFYDCKKDEQGNPLEQVVSIEMPSGKYFKVRELRGFNKSDLEQMVKSFEYFNCRKFDS